eukprot:s101_g41.t1
MGGVSAEGTAAFTSRTPPGLGVIETAPEQATLTETLPEQFERGEPGAVSPVHAEREPEKPEAEENSPQVGLPRKSIRKKRTVNVEADNLTNEIFTDFNPGRRIAVKWEDLQLPMTKMLMRFAECFSKRKLEVVEREAGSEKAKFTKIVWG